MNRHHPDGEGVRQLSGFSFNGSLKVSESEQPLSENTGALLLREVLDRYGTLDFLAASIVDPRNPARITHPLRELLAERILLLAQGFQHQDDADRLRDDPVFRLAVSERTGQAPLEPWPGPQPAPNNPPVPQGLASQPTQSRLVRLLSSDSARTALREALLRMAAQRIRAANRGHRKRYETLDIDGIPIEVSGHPLGAEHNGYYGGVIFHPLVASLGELGDYVDASLRPGNVASSCGLLEFTLPLLDRLELIACQIAVVRIDAGMPDEPFLNALEQRSRPTPYIARIRNNPVLDRLAQAHLQRPPGPRPVLLRTWLHEDRYKAGSWSVERRVVLVVQEQADTDELHWFWLLTNWSPEQMPAEELLERYRRRGTGEGHHGEFKSTLGPALASVPRPKSHYRGEEPKRRYPSSGNEFLINEATFLLNMLAYEVMHVARTLIAAGLGEGLHLQQFRNKVLRVASKIVRHAHVLVVVVAASVFGLWNLLLQRLQAS